MAMIFKMILKVTLIKTLYNVAINANNHGSDPFVSDPNEHCICLCQYRVLSVLCILWKQYTQLMIICN